MIDLLYYTKNTIKDEYFQTWQGYIYDVSRASINYMEVKAGGFFGKQVVVIGTNNINDMVPDRIEQYTERYMSAI